MKALVCVPSYDRPYVIDKRTGFWLKSLKDNPYKVFVEPDQSLYYSQTFSNNNIVETGNKIGLYGQLIAIGKYGIENGYDLITKIDDDTYFTDEKRKKTRASEVFDDSLNEIKERFANNPKLGVVGFTRGMDYFYNKGKGFKTRKKPIYGTCVARPEVFANLDPNFYTFADLFISVVCKELGYEIETYYNCNENRLDFTNDGGLQSSNRKALSLLTIERAIAKYPKCKIIENGLHGDKITDLDVSFYV
tara:strand:- start:1080 stop:1823 length:744 start_codon:yes stop_codon:yes gene_type:complete